MSDTNTSNRLPILASEIRRAHADVQDAAKTAAERAIEAGHALLEAKKLVKHGEWLPWLREHCALAERTAQLYMKIAESGHTPETVATLGLKAAEKALVLEYCFRRPMFDGEEEVQRDWRLYALFAVKHLGITLDHVTDHIDWIGRKKFTRVEEWLTVGVKWMRGLLPRSREHHEIAEQADLERLASWQSFGSEYAGRSIDEIDAECANLPPPLPRPAPRMRRRKSATVADLGRAQP